MQAKPAVYLLIGLVLPLSVFGQELGQIERATEELSIKDLKVIGGTDS